MSDDRLTTDEAAEYLGVSRTTLVKTWQRGKKKGPVFHKINRNKGYYLRSECEAFKKEHGPFRPAFTKLSDVTAPEDFQWDWATDEELARLHKECVYWSKRNNRDADELFGEAALYIAARPDYFKGRDDPRFTYQRAVEHSVRSLRDAELRRKEMEQLMSDEYWSMT